MSVEVRPFENSMLQDVVTVYNQLTSKTPFCYPLTPEMFTEAVISKKSFNPEEFFVAYENGKPKGFIHSAVHAKQGHTNGGILLFLAEERLVCRALVSSALKYLGKKGAVVCHVMGDKSGNAEFYAGVHMGYEVVLWQGFFAVVNELQKQRFDLVRQGFIMSKNMDAEPEILPPASGVSLKVEQKDDTGSFYTNGIVKAFAGETEIGACHFHILKRLSKYLGQGVGQITISVNSKYHHQGLGQALLSRAHAEMYRMEARKIILATNYSLYPAIKMYEKLGYKKELIELLVYIGYMEELHD